MKGWPTHGGYTHLYEPGDAPMYEPPTVTDLGRDDYIDRVIATVRNHRDSDNSWPQWANELAEEVLRLRERLFVTNEALEQAEVDTERKVSVEMRERVERLRRALDAAMQYVAPKDRDWIERLARGER